jgi:hypothetical protein
MKLNPETEVSWKSRSQQPKPASESESGMTASRSWAVYKLVRRQRLAGFK